ncbi:MAG: YcgL domain-containing protein [Gammaproteobacteria bacterium]|nr:YcgL domain-containing protein [Gammaproteobacteria bacterium]
MYIYLATQDTSNLPETLLSSMGALTLALQFELTADKKLHKEDVAKVIENIQGQGYHVQIPDSAESLLDRHKAKTSKPG